MLKIKKLQEKAVIPTRATADSAGYDLSACLDEAIIIPKGKIAKIPTGIAMALPKNTAGFIYGRSGLGAKHGISPANAVGVVDCDYRGQVIVALINHGGEDFVINHGDRIAQMVITDVLTPEIEICQELEDTVRGQGGFGSTGKN